MVLGIAGGKQVEHVSGEKKNTERTNQYLLKKYLVKEHKTEKSNGSYSVICTYLALDR